MSVAGLAKNLSVWMVESVPRFIGKDSGRLLGNLLRATAFSVHL